MHQSKAKRGDLALFDFDGTITFKDSLFDFIKYAVGNSRFILGLIRQSPNLFAYRLGLLDNQEAKQRLISQYFKGWEAADFTAIAERYSKVRIPNIVRPDALSRIEWHRQRGDTVLVLSASAEAWLSAWGNQLGIKVIGTKLEVINEKISGKFASPNCYGAEKVVRLKQRLDITDFNAIYAYGDSEGDWQMLELADHSFLNEFTQQQ